MGVPLYQAKAELFKTLGHPARIRILELLSDRDHAVHELLEQIEIEASNLSQQLAVLRRSSLVTSSRTGGEVVYSVSVPEVRDLLLAARRILSGVIAVQGELGPSSSTRTCHDWGRRCARPIRSSRLAARRLGACPPACARRSTGLQLASAATFRPGSWSDSSRSAGTGIRGEL